MVFSDLSYELPGNRPVQGWPYKLCGALSERTQGFGRTPARSLCAVFKGIYLEKRVHKLYLTQNEEKTQKKTCLLSFCPLFPENLWFLVDFLPFWVRYSLCTRFSRYIPLKTAQSDLAGVIPKPRVRRESFLSCLRALRAHS